MIHFVSLLKVALTPELRDPEQRRFFFFCSSSPLGELNGSIQIKCNSAGCRSENLQHKRALSESLKTFLVIHLKRGTEGVSRH